MLSLLVSKLQAGWFRSNCRDVLSILAHIPRHGLHQQQYRPFSRIMPASAYPRLFKACGLSQPDFEVFECHWNLARRRLVAPWCLSDSHQLSILSSTIQPPIIQVHKCLIKQPDVCFVSVRRVMCTKIVAHYRFPRERPAIWVAHCQAYWCTKIAIVPSTHKPLCVGLFSSDYSSLIVS